MSWDTSRVCGALVLWLAASGCAREASPREELIRLHASNSTASSAPTNDTDRTSGAKRYHLSDKIWQPFSAVCPLAFFRLGHSCYFYGHFPLNWFRATEFCHNLGRSVSLAVIEDGKENQQIKAWLEKHGNPDTGVWIGGSENGHLGTWVWLPTGKMVLYEDWGPSQPSGGDQHCMYMVGGLLGFQWADFHCDFQMTFLCEYHRQ